MKFTIVGIRFEFYEPIKYDPMRHFKQEIDERLALIEKLVVTCNNEPTST